jgi:hypothetical protein
VQLERAGEREDVADVVVDHQHALVGELVGGARRHLFGLDRGQRQLGEEIRCAADERSTLRIVHLQGQLADYLARVELQE